MNNEMTDSIDYAANFAANKRGELLEKLVEQNMEPDEMKELRKMLLFELLTNEAGGKYIALTLLLAKLEVMLERSAGRNGSPH